MRRLRCTDSACLKRSAEELSPSCAAFLLGSPEPSPLPVPRLTSEVGSERPGGFFSITERDASGAIHRLSGPISAMPTVRPMPMGMASGVLAALPPEFAALLRGDMVAFGQDGDEDADEDDDRPAVHPCAQEIGACQRETGGSSRDVLQRCLVAHFAQLSPECRCFVHHLAGAPASTPPSTVPPPPKPDLVVTAQGAPHGLAPWVPPRPEAHPLHRLSCFLLFATLLLVTLMLARACVLRCAKPSPREKRVVMLPGSLGMPMRPLVVTDVQPVPVAEPLKA